jgi:hypothetical protein
MGLAGLPGAAIGAALALYILYRHGLLALCSMLFVAHLWVFYPMTTELTAWYAFDFLIGAGLCVALAAYACYTSVAGQPIFGGKLLDD